MSEMAAASAVSSASAGSGATGGVSVSGVGSSTGGGVSAVAGISESYASYSESTSIFQSGLSGMSQGDQRFAQAALALLGILLGLQDKDEEKKRSAALMAALMLPAMLRGASGASGPAQMQISQSSYVSESYSVTAVQGASYAQAAGSAGSPTVSVGQNLNISA